MAWLFMLLLINLTSISVTKAIILVTMRKKENAFKAEFMEPKKKVSYTKKVSYMKYLWTTKALKPIRLGEMEEREGRSRQVF
jgi:hypothetical protein